MSISLKEEVPLNSDSLQFIENKRLSDFGKLWVGETISLFGSQISNVAFPLTAVGILNATSKELGILNALAFSPFLLFTLFAGLYADRSIKKTTLITANFGRAFLLLLIPIAYYFNYLSIELMYIITFLAGIFTVFFDATFQSYIPSLVPNEHLVKANAKLIASSSTATVAGQGIGGYLVQLFGSVLTIFIDAVSYMISAFCLIFIKKEENRPDTADSKLQIKANLSEGFQVIFKNPYIRPIVFEAANYNFFSQIIMTIILIYAKIELHLSAGVIGLFFSCGGVGAIIGSLSTEKVSRRIGIGPATIVSMILACTGPLLIPFAYGSPVMISSMIMMGFFLNGIGLGLSNVTCTTIRQTLIPSVLLGRALSCSRLSTWGTIPLGALSGGYLGEYLGLQETLFIGAVGLSFAPLWVVFSPLWKLKIVSQTRDESSSYTSSSL
ncbi:MFS transporter [Bacillus sp. NEB1478]|uniref:MFS transporter n=1 Tax=Bacillus sp. NEB1478 TaxID=3073816 RepID=UPI002873F18C|nr:MFS transporter [Bacillus sp. NEB1478]WNB93370.1 MFS transporter [Bacillus sp. NEB1478]